MRNNPKSSNRGGYVIPPLPQVKKPVAKDGKNRSPLSISPKKKKKAVPHIDNGQKENNVHFSSLARGSNAMLHNENNPIDKPSKGALVPLPFSKSGDNNANNYHGPAADKKRLSGSLAGHPSRKVLTSSMSSITTKIARDSSTLQPIITRQRVLRYRETLESLFCLTSESSEEHRQLCRSIVDGQLVNDAETWLRVLDMACEQEKNANGKPPVAGRDLLRLHRRASSRFPLEKYKNDQSHVFQIWLSYAKMESTSGTSENCRKIFQQLHEHGVGSQRASFYLALADFEGRHDRQRAEEIIQLGLAQIAEPMDALLHAVNKMNSQSSDSQLTPAAPNEIKFLTGGRSYGLTKSRTFNETPSDQTKITRNLSPQKQKPDHRPSPKKRKTEICSVEVPGPVIETHQKDEDRGIEHNMSFGVDELSLTLSVSSDDQYAQHRGADKISPAKNGDEKKALGKVDDNLIPSQLLPTSRSRVGVEQPERGRTTAADPTIPHKIELIQPDETSQTVAHKQTYLSLSVPGDEASKTGQPANHFSSVQNQQHKAAAVTRDGGSALKRPPLLIKTSRLARVGLHGKAQRVGTEKSAAVDSDSDGSDSDDNTTKDTPMKSLPSQTQKSATKLTKMDIDYMWAWNPDGPSKPNNPTSNEMKPSNDQAGDPVPLNSVGHSLSLRSLTSGSRKATQSTDSDPSERSEPSATNSQTSAGANEQRLSGSRDKLSTSSSAVSPAPAKLTGDFNPDFLPLVSESNILRVNNVPYVKLGVVGKGGSSKVYRALSTDCTVLAIKKVKLKGMDHKAIDGYANEIALLKSLQNNPAIIQMYDSEVDPVRKAIFVVMEAGEIDLNHVLQQQAMLSGERSKEGGHKALDLNFIRLTWQQMLSAVHSIHEERIIHGDLKPANFLFVRGALKLIDFGIAKAIQSEDTTNVYRESQQGTLNYMSPETILDTKPGAQKWKYGRASDVWSLGCILYQMVYGRTPFASLHMVQKLQAIIDPDHKIGFPNTVEEAAIDAMKQCLQRKPEDRPPIVGVNGLLNQHRFVNTFRPK